MHLQIQALSEEMESLRNERLVLRRDLQEAAEIVSILAVTLWFDWTSKERIWPSVFFFHLQSKTYQELLHVTKEELKQQQKENADVIARSAEEESRLQRQVRAVK